MDSCLALTVGSGSSVAEETSGVGIVDAASAAVVAAVVVVATVANAAVAASSADGVDFADDVAAEIADDAPVIAVGEQLKETVFVV